MAFVIVKGLHRTALFFISLLGVGEGGGADPCRQTNENTLLLLYIDFNTKFFNLKRQSILSMHKILKRKLTALSSTMFSFFNCKLFCILATSCHYQECHIAVFCLV